MLRIVMQKHDSMGFLSQAVLKIDVLYTIMTMDAKISDLNFVKQIYLNACYSAISHSWPTKSGTQEEQLLLNLYSKFSKLPEQNSWETSIYI